MDTKLGFGLFLVDSWATWNQRCSRPRGKSGPKLATTFTEWRVKVHRTVHRNSRSMPILEDESWNKRVRWQGQNCLYRHRRSMAQQTRETARNCKILGHKSLLRLQGDKTSGLGTQSSFESQIRRIASVLRTKHVDERSGARTKTAVQPSYKLESYALLNIALVVTLLQE